MKKKAAEAADDDDEASEKKYRKCEKAGCTATCPVCFASAAERFVSFYLHFPWTSLILQLKFMILTIFCKILSFLNVEGESKGTNTSLKMPGKCHKLFLL